MSKKISNKEQDKNSLVLFLREAESHIEENGQWTWKTMNWEGEWCCAFAMACAKTVGGLLNTVIPLTYSCTTLAGYGRDNKFGSKFIKGPRNGNNIKPQPGDLILFNWENSGSIYDSDHVGIVYAVKDTIIYTIEGNTGTYDRYTSRVKRKEYSYTSRVINGYFRPDWSKVGGSLKDLGSFGLDIIQELYHIKNTRLDSSIREVGYIRSNKPSIESTSIRLSVINYTDMLSLIYANLTGNFSKSDIIINGVDNTVCRACIEYFLNKGLNAAAACGICGNIEHESGFRTDIIEYGYTFANGGVGLCQWTNYPRNASTGRKTDMVKMAGDNWRNNLTGQLEYLWYELNHIYTNVLKHLKSVTNTESGAKSAADYFVRKFEVPANIDSTSKIRQESAANLFKKIIIRLPSVPGASGLFTQSALKGGTEIIVPSYVRQRGIWDCYTNYSYWLNRWNRSSIQYQIAQIWKRLGMKSSRNIAVIDNYFLIAVKPIYGRVGDILTIYLSDGIFFNAIMADAKGNENGDSGYAQYGHGANGNVNIIEFEATGNTNSPYTGNNRDLTGWAGKTVKRVINRGSYLR